MKDPAFRRNLGYRICDRAFESKPAHRGCIVADPKTILGSIRSRIAGIAERVTPRALVPRSAAAKLRNQIEAEQADVRAQLNQRPHQW